MKMKPSWACEPEREWTIGNGRDWGCRLISWAKWMRGRLITLLFAA